MRLLKFCGFLVIHLTIAVVATTVLVTTVRGIMPFQSAAATLWGEAILSVVFAFLLGFIIFRTWPNAAAKWIWLLAAIWFLIGCISISPSDPVFGSLWFGSKDLLNRRDIRSFYAFTVPLIQAASYSLGAYLNAYGTEALNQNDLNWSTVQTRR